MYRWLQNSLACLFCLMGIGLASIQPSLIAAPPSSVYPDDSDTAETQLRSASANVKDKQWLEAAEIYLKVMQTFGTKAIRLPDEERVDKDFIEETRRWVNLKEHVIALMAMWPKEGRDAYRLAADAQASTLWTQATAADADPAQATSILTRLAFEFYLSSYGEKAIERLGDLAFQNGDFVVASSWYKRLVPLPDAAPNALNMPPPYPGLSTDPALVSAKLVLALYASGNMTESDQIRLLKAFAVKFPESQGTFAGRSGLISTSLTTAIQQDKLHQKFDVGIDWPTFAGDPSRNRVVEDAIGLGARQWRMPLDIVSPSRPNPQFNNRFGGFGGRGMFPRGIPANPNRNNVQPILAYHPIILGDQIIVCSDRRVTAFNLNEASKPDGSVGILWRQEFDAANPRPNQVITSATPRMTLSAKNGRIFARMGQTGVSMDFGNRVGPSNAFLVALDARNKGQVLWRVPGVQIKLIQPNGAEAPALGSIEGAPVTDEKSVYVVITLPGHQTSNYVASLSAESGEVQWVRYLFDAPNPFDLQAAMMGYQANHAHHLLTLANDRLFYQSDSGAVACVDTKTGSLQWLTSYPKKEVTAPITSITTSRRDLNPAVYADGMIFVAPEDSPHLFALDANNGQMRWKSAPLPDVVHLVGVSKGHLFATGDRVWTIEAATGKIIRSWPDTGSGYEAAGRGLLAGNYLYWPTVNEIHILDQKTGLRSERGSIRLRERFQTSGGNLVLGDGFLAVAGTDNLSVFTQNTRLIRRYEQLIAANPESAVPRYRLAIVAESLNETQTSINALRAAAEKVKPADTLDGQSLAILITDRLYKMLTNQAAQTKDRNQAMALLTEASEKAADPVKKQAALVLRASVLIEIGQAAQAFKDLSKVAQNPDAFNGLWLVENRYEVNLYEQARRVMLTAWSKLTETEKRQIQDQESAELETYLAKPLTNDFPKYLAGLSPGRDSAKGWLMWSEQRLKAGDPSWIVNLADTDHSIDGSGKAFKARIDALLEQNSETNKTPTNTGWPATRWSTTESEFRRILIVAEQSGRKPMDSSISKHLMMLGISEAGKSSLIDPQSGQASRQFMTGIGSPVWAGIVAGRGLIFDGSQMVGIDLFEGKIVWRLDLNETDDDDDRNSPFAKTKVGEQAGTADRVSPDANPGSSKSGGGGWWTIHARNGRLMIHNQLGNTWRVNPLTGKVLWHRLAADGPGVPSSFLVGRHVMMRDGSTVMVLDSDSGAMTRSMDTGIAGTDWSREPMEWDSNRVILTPDRMNVAMIDLTKGERVWTWQATPMQPHNGTPRYFKNGQSLIVIADGETAVRLNPETGKVAWQAALGDTDHSREDRDIAIDDKRIYLNEPMESATVPGVLARALNLTDGSLAWKTAVIGPGISWAIASGTGHATNDICVYPDESNHRRIASGLVHDEELTDTTGVVSQASAGAPGAVILDPSTGKIKSRYVAQMPDNQAVWAVPDLIADRIFWGQARSSRSAMVEIGEIQKKVGR